MATIGIIGAMQEEVAHLISKIEGATYETHVGREYVSGTLQGVPVVVCRCGVGLVAAATCAAIMVETYGATAVINTGVAGSLDKEINIGDIVVSTDAVQHDMDCTSLGYNRGIIPDNEFSFFEADEGMRRSAVESARLAAPEKRVFEGRVASGDQFIADSARRQAIIKEHGAICGEMEGAAIGQVCAQNRVPFVIIRAISDKADDSGHLSYRSFVEIAARHSAAIVKHMVENA